MGHYNQIVFSELNTKSIEDISKKIENIFDKFSIKHSVYETPMYSKVQKKYWDLVWLYDTSKFLGELICYIGIKNKNYHLVIGDSSTFRIKRSSETFEKFCNLCQQIAEVLGSKYAVYGEEPASSELFIPSYLNRALDILEMHNNYTMAGLVIIHKSELEETKAQKIIPSNGTFVTDTEFYIYKMQ